MMIFELQTNSDKQCQRKIQDYSGVWIVGRIHLEEATEYERHISLNIWRALMESAPLQFGA